MKKRIISAVLVAVMLIGIAQIGVTNREIQLVNYAQAAEGESLLQMLDINDTAVNVPNDKDNPYGPGSLNMFPRMELMYYDNVHNNNSVYYRRVYDYDQRKQPIIWDNQEFSNTPARKFEASQSAAFDPTGVGKQNYVATVGYVACDAPNSVKGLQYYLRVEDSYGNVFAEYDLGMIYDDISPYEDYNLPDGYEINAFLAITSGDFNGDGYEEIAVYDPDTIINYCAVKIFSYNNSSRTLIQRNNMRVRNACYGGTLPVRVTTNWPIVQLTASDLDKDFKDDLVVTSSFPHRRYTNTKNTDYVMPRTSIVTYSGSFSYTVNATFEHAWDYSEFDSGNTNGKTQISCYGSAAVGDIDGDGRDEIVYAGYDLSTDERNNTNTSGINKSYANVGVIEYSDGVYKKGAGGVCQYVKINPNIAAGLYENNCQSPIALACFNPVGTGGKDYVFIGGSVYSLRTDGGSQTPVDLSHNHPAADYGFKLEYEASDWDSIYSQGTEDYYGNSKTTHHNIWIESVATGNFLNDENAGEQLVFIVGRKSSEGHNFRHDVVQIATDAKDKLIASRFAINYQTGTSYKRNMTYTAMDIDDDGMILQFVEKDSYFSDPNIVAVLQAAPYFEDLVLLNEDYCEDGSTVFGKSSGSGTSETHGFNVTASVITGYEQDITCFGVKLGGVDFELEVSASVGGEWEDATEKTTSVEYSSPSTEDRVILTMTPYIRYVYNMWTPQFTTPTRDEYNATCASLKDDAAALENYKNEVLRTTNTHGWGQTVPAGWSKYIMCVPETPRLSMITVTEFDKVAKSTGEFEPIRGNVLNHSIGDPSTYNHNESSLRDFSGGSDVVSEGLDMSDSDYIWVSKGGGSVTQSIEEMSSSASSVTWGAGITTTMVGNAGGVKAGASAGVEYTGSYTTMNCSSTYIAGTVAGMPSSENGETAGFDFQWRFGSWKERLNNQDCLVLGFITKNVKMPLKSPKNLAIKDSTATTITLNWEKAGGDWTQVYMITDNETNPYFLIDTIDSDKNEYTVEGLNPNTKYTFALRSTDNLGSEASIYTAAVSGKTKYAEGVEVPHVDHISDIHALSGSDVNIKAVATAVDGGSLTYQWQEQVEENDVYVWQNIKNQINAMMPIIDVTDDYNGKRYRCEVGQLIDGKVAYVYSNTVTLYVGQGGTTTSLAISEPYGAASGSYQVEKVKVNTAVTELIATVGTDSYSIAKLADGNYILTLKEESTSAVYQYIADETAKAAIEAAVTNKQETVTLNAANLAEIVTYSEYVTESRVSTGIADDAVFVQVSEEDVAAGKNTFILKETVYIPDPNDPENETAGTTETIEHKVTYTKTYTEGTKTLYVVPVTEDIESVDGEGNVTTTSRSFDTYYYIDSADTTMTEPVEVTVQVMGYIQAADSSKTYTMETETAVVTFEKKIEETYYTTTVVAGDTVTLAALVESTSVGMNMVPTGNVCFKISLNGDSSKETKYEIPLTKYSETKGSAVTEWTPSEDGTYTIVATYYGNSRLLSSSSESLTYTAYEVSGAGTKEVKSFVMNCNDTVINNTSINLAPALNVTSVTCNDTELEDVVTTPYSLESDNTIVYEVRMEYSEAPEGSYIIENNVFTATVNGTYFITATYTDGEGADAQSFTYTKKINVVTTAGEQQPIYFQNSSITVYTTQKTVKNELSNFNAGATVRYKSTDESVATVDETGLVTIHKSGVTSIVATSSVSGKDDVEATYLLYINKQPLTLSVPDDIVVTYGQTQEEALEIIAASGLVVKTNGGVVDNISYSDITGKANDEPTYSITYKQGSGIGRYSVTINEVSSVLYDVTNIGGYFEVVQKEIGNDDIESVNVETKDYDGTTEAELSVTFKEGVLVSNDVVEAEVEGEFDTSEAGENKLVGYQITKLTGPNSGNYVLAANVSGNSTGTIEKAPISVTMPRTTSVVYDGEIKSVNVLAYSNGLYYNDFTVKYVDENGVETTEPVNVGKYNVVIELADPDNFTIKNAYDASLVIKSATQDVFTVEGIPETVTYGDRFEVQTAGAQEGGTITYTVSGVGVDGNPADIAKLETVDGKTYIEITGMGTVTVKATSSLANYNDKSAMRTFTVGKKTLAVKATPVARTYDGTTAVDVVVELDGLLVGDEGITATANGTLATPDAGKSKTVFISDIALSDSSKYQPAITSTQANVDIEKLVITGFEITAEDKVFDKTTAANATVTKIYDVLEADAEYVKVNGSAEFDTKDRGENKTVTFTATGLSGDLSSNYVLADTAKTATCKASIVAASPKDFYVSGHHSNVVVSEEFTLRAFYMNEVTEVVWSSSNEAVATVDPQTGVVKVVGAGSAIIYAAIDEGYGIDPAQFPLNASKKTIQLYATPEELIKTYTGRVQIPEILSADSKFVPDDNNVKLKFVCESGADTVFADPINAGKYKVYYEIVDTEFAGTGYFDMVINKGKIVVKAADIEKLYGATPVYAPVITEGDHIENAYGEIKDIVVYTSEGEPATAPVGIYDINVSLTIAENDNIRFYVDEEVGKLTVNPAPLTLSVKDAVREYGFDNKDPEYEYVGFVNGEDSSVLAGSLTFKYDSSVTKESAIGEYEDVITADSLATSDNYTLTVVYTDGNGADLSIVKVSVKTIMAPLDGVTENNVTSDNEATINEVIAELNEFTPENEEEQKQLQGALDKCNSLLAKIEEARKALGEAEEESAVLDKERATVFWEDDIEEFLDKINSLLENPNMSPAEIEKLENYKTQAEEILEIIHTPIEYISLRFFYLIWDFLTWTYNGIGQLFSNLFNIG